MKKVAKTVKEMIEILQKHDPNMKVFMPEAEDPGLQILVKTVHGKSYDKAVIIDYW